MAKRKRLTPAQPDYLMEPATPPEAPPEPAGAAPFSQPQRAPIAHVAGDAATHAALSAVTAELHQARAEGRLIQALDLGSIEAGYLVRDRIMAEEADLAPLIDSLRLRGQQTPIEVVALEGGRYGLISGWRRLSALQRLRAETGEARFGTVLAILRRPADAAAAYLAMVEENEIRVGLSYYERARIVVKSVESGVFPTARAGLQGLFGAASRARRSKIGSFMAIVAALDGALRFPTALGERAGLVLARALEADGALGPKLVERLAQAAPQTPEAELALLSGGGQKASAPRADGLQAKAPARAFVVEEPLPGVFLQEGGAGGRRQLILSGPGVDAAFRARLEAWLRAQGKA